MTVIGRSGYSPDGWGGGISWWRAAGKAESLNLGSEILELSILEDRTLPLTFCTDRFCNRGVCGTAAVESR